MKDRERIISFQIKDWLISDFSLILSVVAGNVQRFIDSEDICCSLSGGVFFDARINAETRANLELEKKHRFNLTSIYDMLIRNQMIDEVTANTIMEYEYQEWLKAVYADPYRLRLLISHIQFGDALVAIEDDYFPVNFYQEILIALSPALSEIKVYLFREAEPIENTISRITNDFKIANPNNWTNYGYNERICNALHSCYIQTCDPSEYLSYRDNISQIIVKSTIAYPLFDASHKIESIVDSEAGKIGATIGFKLLYPYVCWVLRKSLELGIKDLFFVARDGYILSKIATQIIERYGFGIGVHYIYGSRKAWFLPLGISDKYSFKDMMIRNEDCIEYYTVEDMINAYGNAYGDIRQHHAEVEVFRDAKKHWTFNEFGPYDCVKDNTVYDMGCREANEPQIEILRAYLEQELAGCDKYAFVEMQGTGHTLNRLADILGGDPLISFYCTKAELCRKPNEISYVFSNGYGEILRYYIECMTRAPHGVTVGYEYSGDHIVPVLEDDGISDLMGYGFSDYVDAILRATSEILRCESIQLDPMYDAEGREIINYLNSSRQEKYIMDYFGEMPFSDFSTKGKLAPILDEETRFGKKPYSGMCMELSVLRSHNRQAELEKPEKEYKQEKRIGFTAGAFDLFHTGHLKLIKRCKENCDYLIVGVMTDELIRYGKQKNPCLGQNDRAEIVRAIKYVDEVVFVDFHNTRKTDAWEIYHFDVCFTGDDHYTPDWIEEQRILREKGSDIVFFPYTQGISTTLIRRSMDS